MERQWLILMGKSIVKNKMKATKRAISRSSQIPWFRAGTRADRIRIRKMTFDAVQLGATLGFVFMALYAALTVETFIETRQPTPDETSKSSVGDDSDEEKNNPFKSPEDLGGSLVDYVFPWDTLGDLLGELDDSSILGSLDSVSIITALVLFILFGRREEERQAQYMAWVMLDLAHDRETSYARYNVLQDLNEGGTSLKGLDAPGTDLIQINLEEADLQQATLDKVKFKKAELKKANLTFASLRMAELNGATMEESVLFNANLESADLSGADLAKADLGHANLRHAQFFNANLHEVNFGNSDVEGARFERARNLCPAQIKRARNWDKAEYDPDLRRQLFPIGS